MGLEAKCRISWQGKEVTARVHLDSNKLDVYVRPAVHVAFSEVKSLTAAGGALRIGLASGPMVLQLGDAAERWAAKISQPKGRLEKLGIKPDSAGVCLIGAHDEDFAGELRASGLALHSKPVANAELIFYRVSAATDLARLSTLKAKLAPHGSLWVVREKGKAAPIKEAEVRAAARRAGLVDVKVVSFSKTLTADKYVIPRAQR